MTEDMIDLGRRAVACKGWTWMPGMLTTQSERVVGVSLEYGVSLDYWGTRLWVSLLGADSTGGVFVRSFCDSSGSCLPDFTDAATLGCLLALVRAAYRDTSKLWEGHVEVRRDHRILFFVVSFRHDASGALVEDTLASGSTEVEALVRALEAAAGTSP